VNRACGCAPKEEVSEPTKTVIQESVQVECEEKTIDLKKTITRPKHKSQEEKVTKFKKIKVSRKVKRRVPKTCMKTTQQLST